MMTDDIKVDGEPLAEIEQRLRDAAAEMHNPAVVDVAFTLCAALREAQAQKDEAIECYVEASNEREKRIAELERENARLKNRHEDLVLEKGRVLGQLGDMRAQRDRDRTEAFERAREAINAACSCGGRALGERCCPACEIWHRIKAGGE